MRTARFWIDAAERAARTGAQTLAGLLVGVDVVGGGSVPLVDYLAAAGVAALVSLLMSVGGSRVGDPTSPALVAAS